MSKLRDIIDSAVSASATDDLSTDWDAIVADTERQTKDLVLELLDEEQSELHAAPYKFGLSETELTIALDAQDWLIGWLREKVNEL